MADKKQPANNTSVSIEELTGELPYKMTNDYLFKAFFQKNEPALKGLLCAILSLQPEDISSIEITNPIQIGETIDDKTVILDIKLLLNNQQLINLEMQVENTGAWPERSLTYLCRMFDHLHKGEDYGNVKSSLHISIINFTPDDFPENLFSKYFLYHIDKKDSTYHIHKYSDKFGIYMLQLNQLGKPDDMQSMPELYYWAQFFKATTWEEIKMLAQKNETIKQGIVTLKELTADEKIRLQLEARERYEHDLATALAYGKRQSAAEIQSLQSALQQVEAEKNKFQEESAKFQEESVKKDERIRFLEEQLAKASQK